MTRERRLDLLGTLLRLVLGGVLLVAGALKVTNLGASALAVRAYQLLPYDLAGYVAMPCPWSRSSSGSCSSSACSPGRRLSSAGS